MTDIQTHNVNKIVYLTEKNPKKTNSEIITLFAMTAININTALWQAMDEGYLGMPDEETDKAPLLKPAPREFGQVVTDLEENLIYCMGKLAAREQDIEDHYLDSWLAGYPTHDIAVVKEHLLETGRIKTYDLRDEPNESDYTFYTLPENFDHKWGKKQFDVEAAGIE